MLAPARAPRGCIGRCYMAGGQDNTKEATLIRDFRGRQLVAAQGVQMSKEKEPPFEEMSRWLDEAGVRDLVPDTLVRRAYLSYKRCPFGSKVTPDLKRQFFRRLAPYIDHLAVDPTDLGCFKDPAYVHHIELADTTPIDQPPFRGTPEVEKWLKEEWLPT